jgi:hypothetical protein
MQRRRRFCRRRFPNVVVGCAAAISSVVLGPWERQRLVAHGNGLGRTNRGRPQGRVARRAGRGRGEGPVRKEGGDGDEDHGIPQHHGGKEARNLPRVWGGVCVLVVIDVYVVSFD